MIRKETRYADGVSRPPHGVVKYVFNGTACVFSGYTSSREFMSTVNAAEYVIEAIAAAEKIDPRGYTFFDLRTRRGYPDPQNGWDSYHLSQLTVEYGKGKPEVTHWTPVPCSNEVLRAFEVLGN